MPIRITAIDRIISGIGITVEVDPCQDWIKGVGGEEASEVGIIVSGMEILQPGLGIIAFIDIGLAIGQACGADDLGIVTGQRLSKRAIVGCVRRSVAVMLNGAVGGQMILEHEVGSAAHPHYIWMQV